jgi:DNA-binding ferritin-like protein
MAEDALAANQAVVDCLYEAFDAAEDVNLEGIMNFLAERIDTHSKHAWMLSSIVGRQV